MRLPEIFILWGLGGAFFSLQASAQNYPIKVVRVIVPTAAGGNPDFNRHRKTFGHGAGGSYLRRSRIYRGFCKRLVWIVRAGGDATRDCGEATRRGCQGAGVA